MLHLIKHKIRGLGRSTCITTFHRLDFSAKTLTVGWIVLIIHFQLFILVLTDKQQQDINVNKGEVSSYVLDALM